MFGPRLPILVMTLAVLVASEPARAQSAERFYPGRQMVLIVGAAAGSGYDVIGRMVAKYMGNYLPGKPSFIVRNMPGAGGVVAANHMNSAADKDGATIATGYWSLQYRPSISRIFFQNPFAPPREAL